MANNFKHSNTLFWVLEWLQDRPTIQRGEELNNRVGDSLLRLCHQWWKSTTEVGGRSTCMETAALWWRESEGPTTAKIPLYHDTIDNSISGDGAAGINLWHPRCEVERPWNLPAHHPKQRHVYGIIRTTEQSDIAWQNKVRVLCWVTRTRSKSWRLEEQT